MCYNEINEREVLSLLGNAMADFGRLILSIPGRSNQVFSLNKPIITLGRATTNDVTLVDPRVSRNHARIECSPEGITLFDLASANGTFLNDEKILAARMILPGDRIKISGYLLEYQASPAIAPEDITLMDSMYELDKTLSQLSLPVFLNETSQPRLVIQAPDRTWEMPLVDDCYTIGRNCDNKVVLQYQRVSRHHAVIERVGKEFVLRDLQSMNGTWVGRERVEQRQLKHGDTILIGQAKLIFKEGFSQDELTIIESPHPSAQAGLKPVVFVPGMMGSQLWLGSEQIWPNVKYLFTHPEIFLYSEDSRLEPRGIVNEVVIVPNLITLEQYSGLGDYMVEELGYERGKNFLEFAYDWRQDVRKSAQKLAEAIEAWNAPSPVTIIGHSLGTLVSRYYVECLGGKKKANRLLLIGGPHQGVPKIVTNLLSGLDLLPFGLMGERLTQIVETFPSSYQILPLYTCAADQNGQPVNFFQDESWIKPPYRPLLHIAHEFRRELGTTSRVPTVSIFGYGLKTTTHLQIQRDLAGLFQKVTFNTEPSGDTTIPENSAVLAGTEIHPVQQNHGSLFNDNDVRMRLKYELLNK